MKPTMIKNLNIFIVLLFLTVFSSGCEKAPMNGNADVQLQLVEIRDKSENKYGTFVGRFNYDQEAEKITVKEFSVPYNTNTLATREQLLPFGMDSTETVFDVIKADGKSLILRSDYATLTFRSF